MIMECGASLGWKLKLKYFALELFSCLLLSPLFFVKWLSFNQQHIWIVSNFIFLDKNVISKSFHLNQSFQKYFSSLFCNFKVWTSSRNVSWSCKIVINSFVTEINASKLFERFAIEKEAEVSSAIRCNYVGKVKPNQRLQNKCLQPTSLHNHCLAFNNINWNW